MYKLYLSFITSLLVHVHSQTSNSTNNEVCQGISTVVMSLEEVYRMRGLFVTAVPDEGIFPLLDNLCVTAFPIFGSQGLYTFYSNVVLTDGTAVTTYTLAKDVPPGTFRRSNPDGTVSQRFFSYYENFTLACTQFEFGDNPSPPLFATSITPDPNSEEDIQQMEDIFRSEGFTNVSLYALPMRLPTQCVLREPCNPKEISRCAGGNRLNHCEIVRRLGLCH